VGRSRITRLIACMLAAGALVGWGVTALAGTPSTNESTARPVRTVARTTHFYGVGPSAEYDFDSGSIGIVDPIRLALPAGATYNVEVTVATDYRTSDDDRFVLGLNVRRDDPFGPKAHVRPDARPLSGSTIRNSATSVFVLRGLSGGHEFWFSPTVNVSRREGNRASIATRHVVLVVDVSLA
jgi:hypothetical protein